MRSWVVRTAVEPVPKRSLAALAMATMRNAGRANRSSGTSMRASPLRVERHAAFQRSSVSNSSRAACRAAAPAVRAAPCGRSGACRSPASARWRSRPRSRADPSSRRAGSSSRSASAPAGPRRRRRGRLRRPPAAARRPRVAHRDDRPGPCRAPGRLSLSARDLHLQLVRAPADPDLRDAELEGRLAEIDRARSAAHRRRARAPPAPRRRHWARSGLAPAPRPPATCPDSGRMNVLDHALALDA